MDYLLGQGDIYPDDLEQEVDRLNQAGQYPQSYHLCEKILIQWADGIEWYHDNYWYKEDAGDEEDALKTYKLEKASIPKPDRYEWKKKKPSLRLMDLFSIAAYYTGNYHRAFHIQYKLLNSSFTDDPGNMGRIKGNIHYSIDKDSVKHKLDFWPEDVVLRLKARGKGSRGLVTLTMTTCKRLELFKRTFNSFLNACKDVDLIDRFLIIDDHSSDDDCNEMLGLYPFIELVRKTPEQKGHPISMNMIVEMVDTKYCLHLEDDHEFFCNRNYIRPSMRIMLENPEIGQVLFNENYGEIPSDLPRIAGGEIKTCRNGKKFRVHIHYRMGTPEYNQYMAELGTVSNTHWPHYSFRPALINTDVWKKVERKFLMEQEFERNYAYAYVEAGYKSAFLIGLHHIHIGRTSHDLKAGKNVENAYTLNKTRQWGY